MLSLQGRVIIMIFYPFNNLPHQLFYTFWGKMTHGQDLVEIEIGLLQLLWDGGESWGLLSPQRFDAIFVTRSFLWSPEEVLISSFNIFIYIFSNFRNIL